MSSQSEGIRSPTRFRRHIRRSLIHRERCRNQGCDGSRWSFQNLSFRRQKPVEWGGAALTHLELMTIKLLHSQLWIQHDNAQTAPERVSLVCSPDDQTQAEMSAVRRAKRRQCAQCGAGRQKPRRNGSLSQSAPFPSILLGPRQA